MRTAPLMLKEHYLNTTHIIYWVPLLNSLYTGTLKIHYLWMQSLVNSTVINLHLPSSCVSEQMKSSLKKFFQLFWKRSSALINKKAPNTGFWKENRAVASSAWFEPGAHCKFSSMHWQVSAAEKLKLLKFLCQCNLLKAMHWGLRQIVHVLRIIKQIKMEANKRSAIFMHFFILFILRYSINFTVS